MLRVHTYEVRLYSDTKDEAVGESITRSILSAELHAIANRCALVSVETDALEPDDVPAEERRLVPIGGTRTIGQMLGDFEARRAELRQERESKETKDEMNTEDAKKKLAPENTTETTGLPGSAAPLVGSLLPGAIEAQEAAGQLSFVGSDTLPTEFGSPPESVGRAALESSGVRFGDPVEGDRLFRYVDLSEGWGKQTTEHAMWSKLVDQFGRERASIFYKAAFYDRRATINVCRRFSVMVDYPRIDEKDEVVAEVLDCGAAIYATDAVAVPPPVESSPFRDTADLTTAATEKATAWLAEHFPDWESYSAYWDEETTEDKTQ